MRSSSYTAWFFASVLLNLLLQGITFIVDLFGFTRQHCCFLLRLSSPFFRFIQLFSRGIALVRKLYVIYNNYIWLYINTYNNHKHAVICSAENRPLMCWFVKHGKHYLGGVCCGPTFGNQLEPGGGWPWPGAATLNRRESWLVAAGLIITVPWERQLWPGNMSKSRKQAEESFIRLNWREVPISTSRHLFRSLSEKCFMVQFGRVHLHALYNNHSQHCRTCLAC